MSHRTEHYDVAIVGGGPAGLAAACLVARAGARTALFPGHSLNPEARRPGSDPRTTALMRPTLRLLETLELWPAPLQSVSAPLWRLRLLDETNRFVTASPITFDAHELGEEPFGWNIPNEPLVTALADRMIGLGTVAIPSSAPVATLETGGAAVTLGTRDGVSCSAGLVVAADGRQSTCRSAAGIKTLSWAYDQAAIATSFAHELPHDDVSTEHHRPGGPLTTVPLPGNWSSLVWMEPPEEVERLMALSPTAFARTLTRALGGDLGAVSQVGPRRAFPATTVVARTFAKSRVMLVGEAAHVSPPIGAQGLNMGLRDAALAAELVEAALEQGLDPGGEATLAAFDRRRRRDVLPRQLTVDLMNRTLLSGFMPAHAMRAAGVFALSSLGPLRRLVMREGLGPTADMPKAMRG